MIYDYSCENCGKSFEEFVFTIDEPVSCPDCGKLCVRMFPLDVNLLSWPAEGLTLEHLPNGAKTFKSRSELKKYAQDNNLELGALL